MTNFLFVMKNGWWQLAHRFFVPFATHLSRCRTTFQVTKAKWQGRDENVRPGEMKRFCWLWTILDLYFGPRIFRLWWIWHDLTGLVSCLLFLLQAVIWWSNNQTVKNGLKPGASAVVQSWCSSWYGNPSSSHTAIPNADVKPNANRTNWI